MSVENDILTKIRRRYLLLRAIETLMLALGISLIFFALGKWLIQAPVFHWLLAIGAAVVVSLIQIQRLHLRQFGDNRIALYLNQHYPQLEASADLVLAANEDLSTLQILQKTRTSQRLRSIEEEVKLPHQLPRACLVLAAGLALGTAAWLYTTPTEGNSTATKGASSGVAAEKKESPPVIASLQQITVTVSPPTYTGLAKSTSTAANVKVVEGSQVAWSIAFDGEPAEAAIVFSGKETAKLNARGKSYDHQRALYDGGFYQLTWKDHLGADHQSDYFSIEIIKDEPPHIAVQNLAQFTELRLTDRPVVDLNAQLTDDFGLTDSHIIATVSKGSGESVKFREETLRFFQPAQFSGRQANASRSIDILKLGLEPGDELYFYIEAFDNKAPMAGKSRTETFFIALKDTTTYEAVEEEGLGVDLMPEYFRSQRQIIIDSEKLLEDRKKKNVTKEEFNSKSNELGYDQKVLRLRYGQFLGEEFESGIGTEGNPAAEEHDDDKEENPMDKFGHKHDTENEHNLVAAKKDDSKKENPMDAYAHKHDDDEEATFFTQSIKTKLRTALTLMWDAELYLRMYQPETSLPYQYKILKLLKEISNDSRVYVHRTGFDPPPLKEEKRLSGDLSELKNSFYKGNSKREETYPAIRQALTAVEALLLKKEIAINASAKAILQKAGNEVAGIAIRQPGLYLQSLSNLKSLVNNEIKPDQLRPALLQIRNTFWKIIPPEAASPAGQSSTTHPLETRFLKQLQESQK